MNEDRIQVLDHGYVELVEAWGSDERIIESARMSTAKGFLGWGPKGWACPHTGCDWIGVEHEADGCPKCGHSGLNTIPGDEKLFRYLWKNQHSTPFEFAGMTIEVQAPLMVFREWHRHRTQSYSERSARYTPLPDVNYMPTVGRVVDGRLGLSGSRQAAAADGAARIDEASARAWLDRLGDFYTAAEQLYQDGLKRGVPKELARLCIPVGRYSTMRATTDLRNWLAFCALRLPTTAQQEIRVYAQAVHALLARLFPRTVALFDEGP